MMSLMTRSGRKRVEDESMIERVRQEVENSPKKSHRKRAQALGLISPTLRKILRARVI